MRARLYMPMRLAGDPEIYEALAHQWTGGDAPQPPVDDRLPQGADVTTEPEAGLNRFFELHTLLRSKGYSEQAAQHSALEMLEGREPEARSTRRFAGMYGETHC